MFSNDTPSLDLHVRLEPELAEQLRAFASESERTLGGCVRLLLRHGLSQLELAIDKHHDSPPRGERK
jgi:hypothetical protein